MFVFVIEPVEEESDGEADLVPAMTMRRKGKSQWPAEAPA